MSMDLIDSVHTFKNSSCNMLMMKNNVVAAGTSFVGAGFGQPFDDARSKLQQQHQSFDYVSKYTGGKGMTQASSSMKEGFFPFTNSQWKELERQAMVFKFMMHSIPVPYDLLFPFIASAPTDLSGLMMRRDTNLLKFLKNGDPEPGRCRRTDGKKWRCANAVAIDQKYCEKHVHRSRPRSRKHVETPVASDLNKIHKKPCLDQAQNQSNISHQNSTNLNRGGFTNDSFRILSSKKPPVPNISVQNHLRKKNSADEQWQNLMQFPQHHQLSLDSYIQRPKQGDMQEMNLLLNPSLQKPTSLPIDQWTLNRSNDQHDFVSLGLSMGQSYTEDDDDDDVSESVEIHDWLSQSGGPLGEVLRPPLTASSPTTTTTNGVSSTSCTTVLQEAVASLSNGSSRH